MSEPAAALWDSTSELEGDALAYLKARNCVIPPLDSDLRYIRRLKHPSGYEGPALIALVTNAATAAPVSLHRTWILPNGEKAPVEKPRLLIKGHRVKSGCIRLWPDEFVTYGLALAEGIETALSVAHAFTPVWSCIDAGNLAAFPVLAGIESLVIAADADAVGMKAAADCSARWAKEGRQVAIASPEDGRDWNDEARAA